MSAAVETADGIRQDERRAMGVACGAHALHDGYTDLIYVMLPIWQAEFALSYAAIGALRAVFAGTMAGFQIPAGLLSERFGTPLVLALGTALAGLGYCLAPLVDSYAALVAILFVAGLGASTQHPLASALVARAYAGARSLAALGTYNFASDLGKMAVPAGAARHIPKAFARPGDASLPTLAGRRDLQGHRESSSAATSGPFVG